MTRVVGPLEAASFEVHPDPQFVFDEQVRVVALNRAGRELVERANGPRGMAELLVNQSNGGVRHAFDAVREAIRTQRPSEEIALCAAPHVAHRLRAIPLAPPHRNVLVVLRPIETRAVRTPRERFDFTPMEERVADLLCRGKTPARIATDLRISVETVRCHLKQAFAKTGAHRQAELVALLLGS